MKIVAQTTSGFLVEASSDELDKLAGRSSYNSNKAGYTDLKIGSNIEISGAYHQLHNFSKTVKAFSETANRLRSMAELLEKAPAIVVLTPEDTNKLNKS